MPEGPPNDHTAGVHAPFGRRGASLQSLWDDVVHAREEVAAERHDPQRHAGPNARQALVDALEAYIFWISERGHPTPYPLANELRMQRLALSPMSGTSAAHKPTG